MPSVTRIAEDLPGRYFQEVHCAYTRAVDGLGGSREIYLNLAGIHLCIQAAGDALLPKFIATLAHLEIAKPERIDFTICCWDDKAAGSVLPMPTEWMLAYRYYCCLNLLSNSRYRAFYIDWSQVLACMDIGQGIALCCFRDAERLLLYEISGPMRTIISSILNLKGMHLIHAAAVGTERGSLVFAGPPGSGKSTLATLCLREGLGFQSDDLCAISGEEQPRSFCIYNIAKLREDVIPKFESFRPMLSISVEDGETRGYFYTHRHFPGQVLMEAPVKALMLPRISHEAESRLERANPIEAMRGVIEWTLREIPRSDALGERIMLRAISRIPAYHLHLGRDDRQTLALIRSFLDEA